MPLRASVATAVYGSAVRPTGHTPGVRTGRKRDSAAKKDVDNQRYRERRGQGHVSYRSKAYDLTHLFEQAAPAADVDERDAA